MLARAESLIAVVSGWALYIRVVTIFFMIAAVTRMLPVRGQLGRRLRGMPLWAAAVAACVAVVGGLAVTLGSAGGGRAPVTTPFTPAQTVAAMRKLREGTGYVGVFEPREFASYRSVVNFGRDIGRRPGIVAYYSGWDEPFATALAQKVAAHGGVPLVFMEPAGVSMAGVADGKDAAYLDSFARQVKAYGHPVILSFAAEANGNWDSWGWEHVPPATWIAAYRRVVTTFRRQGARNVIWLWVMNAGGKRGTGVAPAAGYWPGSAYVGWAGIDGYYYHRSTTFTSTIAPTVEAIRRLTTKPILLSETGIGQVAGQVRKIPDLFAGIRTYHLIGLVWFDMAQHDGINHQDWRLEGHPAAIAAFRRGVASVTSSTASGKSP